MESGHSPMQTRPVWAEISRTKLIANYLELQRIVASYQSILPPIEILAVVKANAYGHGLLQCAPALVEAGAKWIGVTSVEEGVIARAACPQPRILVMSGIFDDEAEAVIEHRLTPLVWESYQLDILEAAARAAGLTPKSIRVHLELDTGMARQGLRPEPLALGRILQRFHPVSALRLEGIATHFSSPEVLGSRDSEEQVARFKAAVELAAWQGHRPAWIHAGNSASLLRPDHFSALQDVASTAGAHLMLRPGLALYGYQPRFSPTQEFVETSASPASAHLKPVLSWKTRITSLREIQIGDAAGYNSTFHAKRLTRLGLMPIGYADGLSRLLSNRGAVLVGGQRAPIVGRVSMDQTILDLTDIPLVTIGDEVVVIGTQGDHSISAYDIADLTGTIPYEVLCGIAARIPRLATGYEHPTDNAGAAGW
jgi:alanine racemase